ncbi:hypothetical protein MMC24_002853 [Lignoscripta atroalba]|nr:hypothetical protein [Lignoscripta atroalba]
MLAGLLFSFWRLLELLTLIPTLGMLAYFVHQYVLANQLTPNFILVPFIISVLASAWALATLLRRDSTRRSHKFVAFIDLCFVGAFIAAAYLLRFIARENCTQFTPGTISVSIGTNGISSENGASLNTNKTCAMLKASFAFLIMNCIFFFVTFILAFMMRDKHDKDVVVKESTVRRRSHDSR